MRLIGVDPGKNTGYAILDTDYMVIEHMSIEQDGPYECTMRVGGLNYPQVDVIVVERFVPRFGTAFDCTPMYLIGGLQAIFTEKNINLAMPASHKGSVPRAKTKALMKVQGFKIGAGHSLDALSLCLYWAAFKLKDKNAIAFLAEEV